MYVVDNNSLHLCPRSQGRKVLVAAPPGHPRQLAGGRAGARALHPRTHPHRGEARGYIHRVLSTVSTSCPPSIRCSGDSSPSAGVTRACGATWQTRRSDIYNIFIYISTHLHIYNICTGPLACCLSRLHREFLRLWCSGGRHGAAAREGSRGLEPELNHWSPGAGGL